MKINRVVFIVPSTDKAYKKDLKSKLGTAPLGVAYISAMLKLNGYETMIIDMLIDDLKKEQLDELMLGYNPDVVCISGAYTESIKITYKIAKYIKHKYNKILITGGAHVTFLPEEALKNSFDYVILKEGESVTVKLLEYLKNWKNIDLLKSINGIAYRNDQIHIQENNSNICDLDGMPFPDISTLKMSKYATPMSMITSRGCPGNCIYCASRNMSGKKYRLRSAENIFSEIYYMKRMLDCSEKIISSYLAIYDDTFTVNISRLNKLCYYMVNSGLNKLVKWKCESRIDVLTEERIVMMKEAGCIALHMGLESYNQDIIDSLNKHINIKNMENVIYWTAKHGIQPLCSFIIGNHKDTHETIQKTKEFIIKIIKEYHAVVALSVNTPLPGTELYNNSENYGVRITSRNWSDYSLMQTIIETDFLSNDEIRNYYVDLSFLVEDMVNMYVRN